MISYTKAIEILNNSPAINIKDIDNLNDIMAYIQNQKGILDLAYKQMSEYFSGEMKGVDERSFQYEVEEYITRSIKVS